MRKPPPVVVTDLREPLTVVHGRMIRVRLVLLAVWLVGWVVAGLLNRTGWLAVLVLVLTGPCVWAVGYAVQARRQPGRREPVSRRELGGPGAAPGR